MSQVLRHMDLALTNIHLLGYNIFKVESKYGIKI